MSSPVSPCTALLSMSIHLKEKKLSHSKIIKKCRFLVRTKQLGKGWSETRMVRRTGPIIYYLLLDFMFVKSKFQICMVGH